MWKAGVGAELVVDRAVRGHPTGLADPQLRDLVAEGLADLGDPEGKPLSSGLAHALEDLGAAHD